MRTPRAHDLLLLVALLPACARDDRPAPPTPAEQVPSVRPAVSAREVFRLERDARGGLRVSGVVATPEARALLLAEVRRRWPGVPVTGDLEVERDAPALWVPEAMALMPYAAGVENGGLVVRAETGAAGGGVLSITGRVPDDDALARLAADAGASVAPPFEVETPLDVGMVADSTAVGQARDARTVVISADTGLDDLAGRVRSAIGDAAVAFRPGTAELEPASVALIAAVAGALADEPVRVEVSAAGEDTGSSSLDRALASRRAAAIAEALRTRGLDENRVVTSEEPSVEGHVTFRLSGAASH